jgi:hypothetical protein
MDSFTCTVCSDSVDNARTFEVDATVGSLSLLRSTDEPAAEVGVAVVWCRYGSAVTVCLW